MVKKNWLKVLSLVGFVQMILINSLANILPINNKTTGDISDQLQNLFTPEGSTFAIWGLIYFLLFIFIIRIFIRPLNKKVKELIKLFIINSILNSSWIFAWHYEYLVISLVVMLGILINLIQINQLLKNTRNWEDKITLQLPFTVYFGWISIASIANVTALLVNYKWNGLGISEELWTVVILIFVVFYFLLIRPQQKRVKQHKEMVNSLKVGSSVITSGGIVAKVIKLNDEMFITVNISNNVDVKIKRDTIVELLENSNQKN